MWRNELNDTVNNTSVFPASNLNPGITLNPFGYCPVG